jgi:hypothetical protein
MVGRLWAALAGGFLLGLTAYLLVSIFTETPQPMVFLVGWVAFGLLVARSQRPWSNTWATMAVASFLFPVLSFFATINLSARDPIVQTSDAAAAGAALGSIVVGGVAGFFGFFMGIAFALLAFFTRRQ